MTTKGSHVSEKLQECPFCGSEDVEYLQIDENGGCVICNECAMNGPHQTDEQSAIHAWKNAIRIRTREEHLQREKVALRNQFAMAALPGIIKLYQGGSPDGVAIECYEIADAMLIRSEE